MQFHSVMNGVWVIEELKLQQTSALVIALQGGEVRKETRKASLIFFAFYNVDTLFSFRMTTVHQGQVGQ